MTLEQAVVKVAGVLAHPSFSARRPDVVIEAPTDNFIRISGPRKALDRFTPALLNSGLGVLRPAPATLLVVVL